MIGAIARRLFGTANERYLKTLRKDVDAINALEPSLESLSDEELAARKAAEAAKPAGEQYKPTGERTRVVTASLRAYAHFASSADKGGWRNVP